MPHGHSRRSLLAQNCRHAAVSFHDMHISSAVMPTSSRLLQTRPCAFGGLDIIPEL